MSRLSAIEGETFDVTVIGGGIIGCGIARDAATRGLRVALLDQSDFGSGTTSASTRIIHGGLRYLEMLDLRLVRLDLRERETLLRIAPHLVKPLEFLIPFFAGQPPSRTKIRAGLAVYDALSFDKTLPSRRWLSAEEARTSDRALQRPDLQGAAAYHDARVDSPERLALENALDAERHHASLLNYCEAVSAEMGGALKTVRVRDLIDGAEGVVTSRTLVNATGAWFDGVNSGLTSRPSTTLRTTKGIHLVCPPLTDRALVLFSKIDRRLIFAIPRHGLTWIGTTDTDYTGNPAEARATRADVRYLLESVRGVFPQLGVDQVLHTTAGVRALVRHAGSESSVSRMHRILDGEPLAPEGVVSVLGGKITGYRAIAEEVTDVVSKRLRATARRSVTAEQPLPGATGTSKAAAALADFLPSAPLLDLYGTNAHRVAELARSRAGLERRLSEHHPDIAAQVVYGVRFEHCLRLSDFMRRRTLLGASSDQGWDAAAPAATLMAGELGWSQSETVDELERYRGEIAASVQFREEG